MSTMQCELSCCSAPALTRSALGCSLSSISFHSLLSPKSSPNTITALFHLPASASAFLFKAVSMSSPSSVNSTSSVSSSSARSLQRHSLNDSPTLTNVPSVHCRLPVRSFQIHSTEEVEEDE